MPYTIPKNLSHFVDNSGDFKLVLTAICLTVIFTVFLVLAIAGLIITGDALSYCAFGVSSGFTDALINITTGI